MAERILPTPDVFATCCPDGEKILEYYAATFGSAYVQLHPFIKAVSIKPDQFSPATYPARSTILNTCVPVSWSEVVAKTGLPSIAAVDVGLRTMILGLRKEFSCQEYADKIESLAGTDQILPPDEGHFSDLLHDRTLSAIQSLGYQWVWVGDELGTERKLFWIEDLKGNDTKETAGHCNIFTPDRKLLWTTHWDSHFSLLCSSERNLLDLQNAYEFEGFFCTSLTEVYWSVRS